MNIGKNIQILRKNLNMTQQDLAECLGLSRSAISRIEKKNFLDTKTLDIISKKFNIPIAKLLEDNIDKYNTEYSDYEIKTIRDINRNSIEMYRKLSDRHKTFTRAIGLEIHKEITHCENKVIQKFSKDLIYNLKNFSLELKEDMDEKYLDFITDYTKLWISQKENCKY